MTNVFDIVSFVASDHLSSSTLNNTNKKRLCSTIMSTDFKIFALETNFVGFSSD